MFAKIIIAALLIGQISWWIAAPGNGHYEFKIPTFAQLCYGEDKCVSLGNN